jgi:hypothetical protein
MRLLAALLLPLAAAQEPPLAGPGSLDASRRIRPAFDPTSAEEALVAVRA